MHSALSAGMINYSLNSRTRSSALLLIANQPSTSLVPWANKALRTNLSQRRCLPRVSNLWLMRDSRSRRLLLFGASWLMIAKEILSIDICSDNTSRPWITPVTQQSEVYQEVELPLVLVAELLSRLEPLLSFSGSQTFSKSWETL